LYIQKLLHHGVPVLPSPERAARAMAALVDYARLVDKIKSNTQQNKSRLSLFEEFI
jgi:acyl-CoA synthetase (NDP forming)